MENLYVILQVHSEHLKGGLKRSYSFIGNSIGTYGHARGVFKDIADENGIELSNSALNNRIELNGASESTAWCLIHMAY